MSAAAATADVENATPAPSGGKKKKKLLLIGGAVLLVLLLAGGGTVYWLKAKAAHAAEADEDGAKSHEAKVDPSHPPAFLPLDPFVVNLADTDADKYAQVGITLELETPVASDQLKAYMPAVRNAILLILAQKTSQDLHDRPGKERLADEIRREAVRPMGIETAVRAAPASKAEASHDDAAAEDADDEAPTKGKAKAKPKKAVAKPATPNPIRRVHFSSFIVQ